MIKLRSYADKDYKDRTWNQAVKLVGQKQAAIHILGDFAKGELTAMGLKAGEDFFCSLAPGANDNMIYAIDIFLMLKVDEPYLKEGQQILFDSIFDPAVQADYNSRKGSMPIRYDVDLQKLDICSRERYKQWIDPKQKIVRFSGIEHPLRTSVLQSTMQQAWTENMTPQQLTDLLLEMDSLANGK